MVGEAFVEMQSSPEPATDERTIPQARSDDGLTVWSKTNRANPTLPTWVALQLHIPVLHVKGRHNKRSSEKSGQFPGNMLFLAQYSQTQKNMIISQF